MVFRQRTVSETTPNSTEFKFTNTSFLSFPVTQLARKSEGRLSKYIQVKGISGFRMSAQKNYKKVFLRYFTNGLNADVAREPLRIFMRRMR